MKILTEKLKDGNYDFDGDRKHSRQAIRSDHSRPPPLLLFPHSHFLSFFCRVGSLLSGMSQTAWSAKSSERGPRRGETQEH